VRERNELDRPVQAVKRWRLDGLVGDTFEHRLRADPTLATCADRFRQVIRRRFRVADHAAQLPVARQTPCVIAVRVGQAIAKILGVDAPG
jgi:hypothetical protein